MNTFGNQAKTQPDIANLADVQEFVDRFYTRIRQDDRLGPIFNDIIDSDWESHLETMYHFWDTVLLGTRSYRGNPLAAHLLVNEQVKRQRPAGAGLVKADFDRWQQLFHETLDGQFRGPRVELAKRAAGRMSARLLAVFDNTSDNGPFKFVP